MRIIYANNLNNLCVSSTSDLVKDWMKLIEGNTFSNPFSSLGFCLTPCWPAYIKRDGMFVFCVGFVFVFCSCVNRLEIVWFELPWIATLLSSITFTLTSLSRCLHYKYKSVFEYGFPISSLYLSTVNSIFIPRINCTIPWSG